MKIIIDNKLETIDTESTRYQTLDSLRIEVLPRINHILASKNVNRNVTIGNTGIITVLVNDHDVEAAIKIIFNTLFVKGIFTEIFSDKDSKEFCFTDEYIKIRNDWREGDLYTITLNTRILDINNQQQVAKIIDSTKIVLNEVERRGGFNKLLSLGEDGGVEFDELMNITITSAYPGLAEGALMITMAKCFNQYTIELINETQISREYQISNDDVNDIDKRYRVFDRIEKIIKDNLIC